MHSKTSDNAPPQAFVSPSDLSNNHISDASPNTVAIHPAHTIPPPHKSDAVRTHRTAHTSASESPLFNRFSRMLDNNFVALTAVSAPSEQSTSSPLRHSETNRRNFVRPATLTTGYTHPDSQTLTRCASEPPTRYRFRKNSLHQLDGRNFCTHNGNQVTPIGCHTRSRLVLARQGVSHHFVKRLEYSRNALLRVCSRGTARTERGTLLRDVTTEAGS